MSQVKPRIRLFCTMWRLVPIWICRVPDTDFDPNAVTGRGDTPVLAYKDWAFKIGDFQVARMLGRQLVSIIPGDRQNA